MRPIVILVVALMVSLVASAEPRAGQTMPPFAVADLEGRQRTQRDLTGSYTVVCAMADSDADEEIAAWWHPIAANVPPGTRIVTLIALDLFGLIPTSTVISEARSRTPRAQWAWVWLSRDGSLAESLALEDSETPWVFVVDPAGRVVLNVHADYNPVDLARVVGAVPRSARR
jgi:hypothetical protein